MDLGTPADELILRALVERFRLHDPASPLIVFSADPDETADAFNVVSVNRWNPFACAGAMLKAKLFVLGGGGLFAGIHGFAESSLLFVIDDGGQISGLQNGNAGVGH